MDPIKIVIIDEHPIILTSFMMMLSGIEEIEIIDIAKNTDEWLERIQDTPANPVQVAVVNMYTANDFQIENVKRIKKSIGRINVLIILMKPTENFILKAIKAGVNGILSDKATRHEILEAVLSLRNGHEYFDKSISNILLTSYINRSRFGQNNPDIAPRLSLRELEVLKLYGEGLTNQEIADTLFLSIRTVETHKNNIMKKINLRTTVDLIKFAIRNNIIDL